MREHAPKAGLLELRALLVLLQDRQQRSVIAALLTHKDGVLRDSILDEASRIGFTISNGASLHVRETFLTETLSEIDAHLSQCTPNRMSVPAGSPERQQ